MKTFSIAIIATIAMSLNVNADDLLIKVANPVSTKHAANYFLAQGLKSEALTENWIRVQGNTNLEQFNSFLESSSIVYVQKNYKIFIRQNPSLQSELSAYLAKYPKKAILGFGAPAQDNPALPNAPTNTAGADPLFSKQWGMKDIGVEAAWKFNPGNNKIIVAVIDTGVDYTHEDLLPNFWRNPKEIPNNNIDDDNNGYVDDVIGWDFLGKDNKPYDLASTSLGDLLKG